jgi:DNA-binding transcriptional LysR family regulator
MDVDQVACFLVLAEERHFGRAAARLGMTTSSLSKRCARLEQELGVRLFERTSRQVRLTPEGVVLIDPARRVFAEAEALKALAAAAAGGRAGVLIVTYSPGNGELVGRVIRALRGRNPDVEVRLEQRLSAEVGAAVLAGKAVVGVCRAVRPKGLAALTLSRVYLDHIVMPADHRLASVSEIGPADLEGETLLASNAGGDAVPRSWQSAAQVAVRYEHWVTETQVMDSVAAGLGLAVLDEAFFERNPRPGVVARRLTRSLQPDPIEDYLVWRADETSEVARQFVEVARTLVVPDGRS